MSLPNILDSPILMPSNYRSQHRLDIPIISPRRNWVSTLKNSSVDEIESLEKSDESDNESDNDSDKIYYQKLIELKNKMIIKQDTNNDALRNLFKNVVDHQDKCQIIDANIKTIQQKEIDLHENYILELEEKITKLKKKLESEKLSSELNSMQLEKCKKENTLLKNRTQCIICKSNDRNILFTPCNHCVCCSECSNSLYTNICPTCRGDINEKLVIFLS